jgi:hypothetical protein
VKTERVGLRTIVTWYQGGEQIVYQANRIVSAQLRTLASAVAIIGFTIGAVRVLRHRLGFGSLIGGMLGGGLAGSLLAFVTGMPLAIKMKEATPDSSMWILAFVCVVGLPICFLIGRGLAKSENLD